MTAFYNWIKIQENTGVEVEVPEGEIIGSTGFIAGRKHIGPMPPGRYRVVNPIGGSATRARNNQAMLVPVDQDDSAGYDGSYFYIFNNDLKKLMSS